MFCLATNADEKADRDREIAVAQAAAKQVKFTDTELGKIDTFFLMHTGSAAKYRTDMKAVDTEGKTLLHLAAQGGINEAVQYLVSKGADVNAKDKNGDTPLHYAALKGLPANVKYLVSVGADVAAKGKNGDTPLHYAAYRHDATYGGANEIFEYLISVGANINEKNNRGFTPKQFEEARAKMHERELAQQQQGQGQADEEAGRQGVRAFQRGDYREVIRLRRTAAEQGNGNASLMVAMSYSLLGEQSEAREWFKKGAEQGNATAQYMYGLSLLNLGIERGGETHFIEGKKWVQKSATQGNLSAIKLSNALKNVPNDRLSIGVAIKLASETPEEKRLRELEERQRQRELWR